MEKPQESIQELQEENKILKSLNPNKVIIPIVIGLGFTIWMLYRDITSQNLLENFKNPSIFWLVMAVLALVIRDGFYIYRIRQLTRKALSWTGSFYTIVLWEFSSAVSPSAVGGTAIAAFLLLKEGISFGKSLAYVLVSAILDNMFFITVGAVVLVLNLYNVFPQGIFYLDGVDPQWISLLKYTFYTSYTVIAVYTALMAYGLFVKPEFIKWLFIKVTSFSFLKRFRKAAEHQGDELVIASAELKGIHIGYWVRAIVSTALVWTSRYFIVNCLIAAFVGLSVADHTLIFSRHVVLWVVLIIAITPGGSGIAEAAFTNFYYPFATVMTGFISILWRMITYYPYLIAGVVFLPRWINRVFFNAEKKPAENKSE
jgi:glycosyltransferase 2 family protein